MKKSQRTNLQKYKIYFPAFFLFSFFLAPSAQALCPLCTIAVGAGVGFSRYLGIDDTVTGLWVGGLAVSLIMWTIDWLDRKHINFQGKKLLVALAYYFFIVAPLYWTGIAGHPFNKFWGMDKLIFGMILGSAFFFLGAASYFSLKRKNNGRAHFPFQKIVMSIAPLVVLSFVFYLATKQ
jgi:hypothetical protein